NAPNTSAARADLRPSSDRLGRDHPISPERGGGKSRLANDRHKHPREIFVLRPTPSCKALLRKEKFCAILATPLIIEPTALSAVFGCYVQISQHVAGD